MTHETEKANKLRRLKQNVDNILAESEQLLAEDPSAKNMLHELQVYQAELEAQRDELEVATRISESLAKKFALIFDLAPVGYVLLDDADRIIEANKQAHILLGMPIHTHVSKRISSFIMVSESLSVFIKWLTQASESSLELKIHESPERWVSMKRATLDAEAHTKLVSIVDVTNEVKSKQQLTQVLRDEDTVARLGGDEFVIIINNVKKYEDEYTLFRRILTAIALPSTINGIEVSVSCSLGITFFPQQETVDAEHLLRQADHAMYQAKLRGKNTFVIFNFEGDGELMQAAKYSSKLNVALSNHQLELVYQPKISLTDNRVSGYEALVRWNHPERGLILPKQFIPMINTDSTALALDEWVIENTLKQLSEWNKTWKYCVISINVSAFSLQQQSIVTRLNDLLNQFPDVNPEQLQLEILESAAFNDLVHVSDIIKQCDKQHIDFLLDDFGTGYSSLSQIKALPIKQIKIDTSFVREIFNDPGALDIISAILGLAKSFHLKTVAEGIETARQLETMAKLGCDYAQGYFIGYPMRAQDVPSWFDRMGARDKQAYGPALTNEALRIFNASISFEGWLTQLERYMDDEVESPPQSDPGRDSLGQWLESKQSCHQSLQRLINPIKQTHQLIFELASQAIRLKSHHKATTAKNDFAKLKRLATRLTEDLTKLIDYFHADAHTVAQSAANKAGKTSNTRG